MRSRRRWSQEQTPLVPTCTSPAAEPFMASQRRVDCPVGAAFKSRGDSDRSLFARSDSDRATRLGPSHTTRNATRTGRATPGAEGNVALLRCRRRVVTRLVLPPRDWSRDATSHPTRTALVHKIVPVRDAPHRALPRSQALNK